MVNGVKKLTDVNVEYPVHFLCLQTLIQPRERHVGASPWSESEAEVDKVDFVHCTQHLGNRTLDDFVFERGDAQGPLAAVGLWDVCTPHGLRPVLAAVNAVAQAMQIVMQVLCVHLNGYPVDASTGSTTQSLKRSFERGEVDVMK